MKKQGWKLICAAFVLAVGLSVATWGANGKQASAAAPANAVVTPDAGWVETSTQTVSIAGVRASVSTSQSGMLAPFDSGKAWPTDWLAVQLTLGGFAGRIGSEFEQGRVGIAIGLWSAKPAEMPEYVPGCFDAVGTATVAYIDRKGNAQEPEGHRFYDCAVTDGGTQTPSCVSGWERAVYLPKAFSGTLYLAREWFDKSLDKIAALEVRILGAGGASDSGTVTLRAVYAVSGYSAQCDAANVLYDYADATAADLNDYFVRWGATTSVFSDSGAGRVNIEKVSLDGSYENAMAVRLNNTAAGEYTVRFNLAVDKMANSATSATGQDIVFNDFGKGIAIKYNVAAGTETGLQLSMYDLGTYSSVILGRDGNITYRDETSGAKQYAVYADDGSVAASVTSNWNWFWLPAGTAGTLYIDWDSVLNAANPRPTSTVALDMVLMGKPGISDYIIADIALVREDGSLETLVQPSSLPDGAIAAAKGEDVRCIYGAGNDTCSVHVTRTVALDGDDVTADVHCDWLLNGHKSVLGFIGDDVTLTVAPDDGYAVTNVTLNGATMSATAENTYKITLAKGAQSIAISTTRVYYAAVNVTGATATYADGTPLGTAVRTLDPNISIKATPDNGYSNVTVRYGDTEIQPVDGVYAVTLDYDTTVLTVTATPVSYAITYVLDGGENAATNPTTYTMTQTVTLSAAVKTGHAFVGWFLDQAHTQAVSAIEQGTQGAVTLYAHFTRNQYEIAFVGTTRSTVTVAYGDKIDLGEAPVKECYTFDGWFLDEAYSQAMTLDTMPDRNITVYAKFTPVQTSGKKGCHSSVATSSVFGALLAVVAFVGVFGLRKKYRA